MLKPLEISLAPPKSLKRRSFITTLARGINHQSAQCVLILSMTLIVAACGDSGGSVGVSNGGSIPLDDGKVYSMLEQHRYEVLPSIPVDNGAKVETWSWAPSAFRSGALAECEGREGFTREFAADNLAEACSVASKCNFSFDQSQITLDDGSITSRFTIEVPVLKSPVGLSYLLQGVTDRADNVSTTATFCLVPINEAPVAENDAFTVVQGESFQITADSALHLLSNDVDDVDASNLALRVSTTPIVPPQMATQFSLRAEGGFTYLFSGDLAAQGGDSIVDSFQYQVTDGTFNSTAEVRITVVSNDKPPVLNGNIPSHIAVAGIPTEFDFSSYFRDPEASQLQFSVVPATLPASSDFDVSVLGVLTGVASSDDVGNHTITVSASDGVSSISSNFLLTIVSNQPPEAQTLADQNVGFGALISVDVSPSFRDPENEPLSYSISTEPPSDLIVNPDSGLITGSLPGAGQFEVSVTVSDGFNDAVNSSFTITQGERPNRAPVFVGTIANQGVTIGETATPSSGEFNDLDEDDLNYSISTVPSGMSFDAATGVLSGAPDQLGVFNMIISANDADGATANSNTFTITVTALPNESPVFGAQVSPKAGTVGEAVTAFTVPFSDPEGEALIYSATDLPSGLSIDSATGTISGTPDTAGTFSVQVSAEDPVGDGAVSNSFTFTIDPPPNQAPTFSGTISDQTVTVGTALQAISGSFADADNASLSYSASQLPANVSINSATGVIVGTPSTVGTTEVVIMATDASGAQVSSNSFTITVEAVPNNAPTFAGPIPSQSAIVGTAIPSTSVTNYFGDIDSGDTLIFSVAASNPLPAGLSLSMSGVISGTPTAAGTSSVVISASDSSSESVSSAPFSYTVSAANVAPVISNRTPSGTVNLVIGTPVTVEFDVSDESVPTLEYNVSSNNALTVVETGVGEYAVTGVLAGTASLTFTVTDNQGLSDSESVAFVVAPVPNAPPQITSVTPASNPVVVNSGSSQSIAITSSDEDVSSLVYSAESADVSIATVTVGAGGNFTVNGLSPASSTEITLTVTDNNSQVANYTFVVSVPAVNQPPVIVSRAPPNDPITEILIGDTDPVSITVTDEDLDSLVYTAESSDEDVVTIVSAGNGLYQITGVAAGTATIVLTVTDNEDAATTLSFEVEVPEPPNDAPTVTGSLSNVTVVEGSAIQAIDISSVFNDTDVLTYTASGLPTGLSLAADNTIVGTPVVATTPAAFDVVISATDVGGSDTTVSTDFVLIVTAVPNDAPVASGTAISDITVEEGVALSAPVDITTPFSDPDGDVLTYDVVGLPSGLTHLISSNTIVGTPDLGTAANPAAAVEITVTATDSAGSNSAISATFEITVTAAAVVNLGPVVDGTLIADVSVEEGVALNAAIDITTPFSDPENDVLSYVVSGLPAGLTHMVSSNTIVGTPDAGTASSPVAAVEITVTATDASGSNSAVSSSFEITVTAAVVANLAPLADGTAIADVSVEEGEALSAAIDITTPFSDPENDALSYLVLGLPSGLTLSASGDAITGTPDVGTATSPATVYDVTVTATDVMGSGTGVDTTFEITVTEAVVVAVNQAPEANGTAIADISIEEGVALPTDIDITTPFSDADDDALTYQVTGLPAGLVLAASGDAITGIPELGTATSPATAMEITVTATDVLGSNTSVSAMFDITVTESTNPTATAVFADAS